MKLHPVGTPHPSPTQHIWGGGGRTGNGGESEF